MWGELVLSYLAAHRTVNTLVVAEEHKKPLFYNPKIERKLSIETIQLVLHDLVAGGYGEWSDEKRSACVLSYRKLDEWAAILWKWGKDNNLTSTVTTIYDLTTADESRDAEFFGLDKTLVLRALTILEKQRRSTVIKGGANIGEIGVKFHDIAS